MSAHILLVEDHRWLRDALQMLLEDEGYLVTVAADGREALAHALAAPPDLVLSDIIMPLMSGPELCGALHEAGIDAPVVFMSAGADGATLAAAYRAAAYFAKPFPIDALTTTLARLTRKAAA
jgi:CheY-like chemotaxis protein